VAKDQVLKGASHKVKKFIWSCIQMSTAMMQKFDTDFDIEAEEI